MEFDRNLKENIASHSKKFLKNPYEPKLADGYSMESSLSNGFNLNFPYSDQFTVQESTLNPIFGDPNHLFSDPNYDPYQSSSNTSYLLKDFIAYASRGDGANGLTYGYEKKPVLNFPPKSSVQGMDHLETDKPLGFSEFRSVKINSRGEDSGSTVKGRSTTRKKAQSKKKRVMINKKNEDNKISILIKGQWTNEEDRLLKRMVKKHGVRKWSQIAQMIPGRLGKQCRERWQNHLRPDIKKDRWSEEEDRILIEAHKEMGNRWAEIAKMIPGRSENTIKNHWNAAKRRQLSSLRSPNPKSYYSPLESYIQTTISLGTCFEKGSPLSDSSKELEAEPMKSEELNSEYPIQTFDDYEKDTIFGYNGKAVSDKNYGCYAVDEGNDDELQFEVKREMDFLELIYQDIM